MTTSSFLHFHNRLLPVIGSHFLWLISLGIGFSSCNHELTTYTSTQVPDQGYWKLRTDYATRRTLVWFYNSNHELIYKEELPQQYLKATQRNIRTLDLLLANLLSRKLVASEVKATQLLADTKGVPYPASTAKVETKITPLVSIASTKAVHFRTVATPTTDRPGVKLAIENPEKEKVFIRLIEDNFINLYSLPVQLYTEHISLVQCNRILDLSPLNEGDYKLEIHTKKKLYMYKVIISHETSGKSVAIKPY